MHRLRLIAAGAVAALLFATPALSRSAPMLSDYQTLVDSLVRDTSGIIQTTDRDKAIEIAVSRYSTDRPRTLKADLTGNGTCYVNLPGTWESNFSRLVSVEYPIGSSPPSMLEPNTFGLYSGLTTTQLRLDSAIATGQTFRLAFTSAHQVTAGTDTIPVKDREAVANWAAGLILQQLANHYAGHGTPTIQADAIDWRTKSSDFQSRANAARKTYLDYMGVDPKKNVAAGTVVDLNQGLSTGGPRFFHHPRRT
jgi:hypothetical protein